ncbi:hypothetical protein, partial [Oceanospirillum beijerinckii]|uniref:hypothetical protein n=1 Tax=Oceanospirillum beijerinckii TaxID=64976 RepID=UPI00056A7BBA
MVDQVNQTQAAKQAANKPAPIHSTVRGSTGLAPGQTAQAVVQLVDKASVNPNTGTAPQANTVPQQPVTSQGNQAGVQVHLQSQQSTAAQAQHNTAALQAAQQQAQTQQGQNQPTQNQTTQQSAQPQQATQPQAQQGSQPQTPQP